MVKPSELLCVFQYGYPEANLWQADFSDGTRVKIPSAILVSPVAGYSRWRLWNGAREVTVMGLPKSGGILLTDFLAVLSYVEGTRSASTLWRYGNEWGSGQVESMRKKHGCIVRLPGAVSAPELGGHVAVDDECRLVQIPKDAQVVDQQQGTGGIRVKLHHPHLPLVSEGAEYPEWMLVEGAEK